MGLDLPILTDAAGSVLDGNEPDWRSLEGAVPDSSRGLLRQLQVLSKVVAVYRAPEAGDGTVTSLPVGTAWGHLQVLERVGEGSFGVVYKAWDPRLEREVALKLLPEREGPDDSSIIHEGRLLARVRHPNIATIYGAERRDGFVGLWMELIAGATLEEELRLRGPFPAREVLDVARQLLDALDAVHRAGMLHRDVKAQNVMREQGGRIVLTDFGAGCEARTPRAGAGTPLYLAPEVLAGEPATPRSDLYGVGVLVYHLLTGDYPVPAPTLAALREAHRDHPVARISWPSSWPRGLQAVVRRALSPDPLRRYESAAAMREALQAIGGTRLRATLSFAALGVAVALLVGTAYLSPGAPGPGARSLLAVAAPGFGARAANGSGLEAGPRSRRMQLPPTLAIYGNGFSRDGRQLAFVDTDDNLAVIDLATSREEHLTRVAARAAVEGCVMSPEGSRIVYELSTGAGRELRVINRVTRAERRLFSDASVADPVPVEWSDDGGQVLSMLRRRDGTRELALIAVDSGVVTALRRFEQDEPLRASLSPDGRFVAYDATVTRTRPVVRSVFVMNVAGGEPRRLVSEPANDSYPLWTTDGRILFLSDRSGTVDAWWMAIDGGEPAGDPVLAARNLGRAMPVCLTREGAYHYVLATGPVDVYTVDLDERASDPLGTPRLLPSRYSGSNMSPSFSPDGHTLAFVFVRGGPAGSDACLVLHDVLTGRERQLSGRVAPAFAPPAWSPGGRTLLIRGTDEEHRTGFYSVDVLSGRATALVTFPLDTASDYGRAAWLSSREILYAHSGRLIARDVETGAERILSSGMTGSFAVAPDHTRVAIASAPRAVQPSVLMVVETVPGGGPPRELLRTAPGVGIAVQGWGAAGDTVIFTQFPTTRREPHSLWRIDLAAGRPQPLGLAIPSNTFVNPISVAATGGRIAYTSGVLSRELWTMEDFLAPR